MILKCGWMQRIKFSFHTAWLSVQLSLLEVTTPQTRTVLRMSLYCQHATLLPQFTHVRSYFPFWDSKLNISSTNVCIGTEFNVNSVVKFQKCWVLKSKMFYQKLTSSKENYCIVWIHTLNFTFKANGIFWFKNINLGDHLLKKKHTQFLYFNI